MNQFSVKSNQTQKSIWEEETNGNFTNHIHSLSAQTFLPLAFGYFGFQASKWQKSMLKYHKKDSYDSYVLQVFWSFAFFFK